MPLVRLIDKTICCFGHILGCDQFQSIPPSNMVVITRWNVVMVKALEKLGLDVAA